MIGGDQGSCGTWNFGTGLKGGLLWEGRGDVECELEGLRAANVGLRMGGEGRRLWLLGVGVRVGEERVRLAGAKDC